MTGETIEKQLFQLVRHHFIVPPSCQVDRETAAYDVPSWDSLSHAVFISEVEAHFGIELSMEETLKMRNLGDLVDALERLPGDKNK